MYKKIKYTITKHNSGICDQDLSFNLSSSNTSVSLPAGSCAYCGIENKFLWYGPHRFDGNDLATIPPVKYVGITEYGGDEYGAYRTYLIMFIFISIYIYTCS